MISTTVIASLIMQCSGGGVAPDTLQNIIQVESGGNPFAIADVTAKKSHYPPTLEAARQRSNALSQDGHNYSAGLMQVNSANFSGYGLTPDTVFDPCKNIAAGTAILKQCWLRAEAFSSPVDRLKATLSCYYSGNFTRGLMKKNGEKISYVDLITQTRPPPEAVQVPSIQILTPAPGTHDISPDLPAVPDNAPGKKNAPSKPFFTGADGDMPAWDVFSTPS